jgi:hypothetical protein
MCENVSRQCLAGLDFYSIAPDAEIREYLLSTLVDSCIMATITMVATALGASAGTVRVSDRGRVADAVFRGRAPLSRAAGFTALRGAVDRSGETVDEVLAINFRAPHSYWGGHRVRVMGSGGDRRVLMRFAAGARNAEPENYAKGLPNGRIDLSQLKRLPISWCAQVGRAASWNSFPGVWAAV